MSDIEPKRVTIHSGPLVQPLAVDEHTAAQMLGISVRTLWDYRHRGELQHVKIGRLVRFLVDDLRRFLELKREETAAAKCNEQDDGIESVES
jgi:excisionase family DNA binding protein